MSIPAACLHWGLWVASPLGVCLALCLFPHAQTDVLCFLFLLKTYSHPSSAPAQNCSVIFDCFLSLTPRLGCSSPLPPVCVPFSVFLLSSCHFQLSAPSQQVAVAVSFYWFCNLHCSSLSSTFWALLVTALMTSPPASEPQCFPLDYRAGSRFFSLSMQDPPAFLLGTFFFPYNGHYLYLIHFFKAP